MIAKAIAQRSMVGLLISECGCVGWDGSRTDAGPDPDSQPRWARPARPRRSTGAKRQPDDHAGHQADAERHRDRLPRVMSDHVLGHLEALAGLAGPLTVLVAEPVAGLLRVVAYGLGRLRDGRRRVRGQVAEEPLDHLAALTRLLLDPTDELV